MNLLLTRPYLKQSKIQPDVVVIMNKDLRNNNDALVNYFTNAHYQLIKSQNEYSIYIQ